MKESQASIIFRHWLKANHLKFRSATFEVKSTRGKDIFNIKELKQEQINHALACHNWHSRLHLYEKVPSIRCNTLPETSCGYGHQYYY